MEHTIGDEERRSSSAAPVSVSEMFEGGEGIAAARHLARAFLADVQGVHGLPVSERAMDVVELVVSELVTNARRHAPGPRVLTLATDGDAVEVSVWDTDPTPPAILPPDPARIGRHGLEIVITLARSFAVHREHAGKRITAAIALADGPGGDGTGHGSDTDHTSGARSPRTPTACPVALGADEAHSGIRAGRGPMRTPTNTHAVPG
ncbi:ATP-binding protein [Embleya scabrispora]|uniref:ATP-binding protein n=1 Tax=Embleya scabrispora TaxID=159449 RepID=UPI002AA2AACB|nr:ATP-binding protein [Embleya scabrispora]